MSKVEKHRILFVINPISGVKHTGLDDFMTLVNESLDTDDAKREKRRYS